MQQRQARVSVRTLMVAGDDDQVTLEFRVLDNGIGIDETAQGKLFTAFTQAESGTKRNYGGTGLGLTISRQLATMMGGEIAVQSELGKGSLFSVQLPFARIHQQLDANEAPSSRLAGLSCLVLGGTDGLAGDLFVYLEHDGAPAARAPDIEAAREWISNHPPGLCVIVIDIPGVLSNLDELRAASRARSNLEVHFVVIGHDRHLNERLVTADLVVVDAGAMDRRAFIDAVAIAAGLMHETGEAVRYEGHSEKHRLLSREEARRQGCLILVAEDNEINQQVILQQLMLLGLTADIASNGIEALKLWQSNDYSVLFADLHMPEMDGYELTAAIRTSENGDRHMPIIAFTANAIKGEEDHCRAGGMDDYLTKPVQLVRLKAVLEKWLPCFPVQSGSPYVALDVNVLKGLVGDDAALIREF